MALGLFAWAGSTFLVATYFAGWYHSSPQGYALLVPFAAAFGGIAQFLCAMWAYRAGDTLGTAMLGTWSSLFIGYGLLNLVLLSGRVNASAGFPELGYWFIVVAAITWMGAIAGFAESIGLGVWLCLAAIGSTLGAIGSIGSFTIVNVIASWLFIIAAIVAWYDASAIVFESTLGRTLPVGRMERRTETEAVAEEAAEPGYPHGTMGQRRVG